jgi:dehydrogenase/reductase SDR family member 12
MNALRKLQFMFRGYLDFTKRKEPLPPLGGTLTGKNFVITGGNSGIGYSAAKGAAMKGANVVLVCRSKQRGEEAVKSLKEETKN